MNENTDPALVLHLALFPRGGIQVRGSNTKIYIKEIKTFV